MVPSEASALCCSFMPGVAAVEQLNALQSALGLIGTSLFLLQAFRVNSSYGSRQCPFLLLVAGY